MSPLLHFNVGVLEYLELLNLVSLLFIQISNDTQFLKLHNLVVAVTDMQTTKKSMGKRSEMQSRNGHRRIDPISKRTRVTRDSDYMTSGQFPHNIPSWLITNINHLENLYGFLSSLLVDATAKPKGPCASASLHPGLWPRSTRT